MPGNNPLQGNVAAAVSSIGEDVRSEMVGCFGYRNKNFLARVPLDGRHDEWHLSCRGQLVNQLSKQGQLQLSAENAESATGRVALRTVTRRAAALIRRTGWNPQ